MRFIHIADIHLGADPYIGSSRKEKREKEIWTSLERVLEVCESKHVEMLLIAGDLFHRQPLRRELKELDYLFSKLTMTEVVIIAGNHDYLKRDSYYRTFQWSKNVHMILDREIQCVEFPAYSLAIYGMSYDTKQITEECYCDAFAQRRQPYEILLAHGGDDSHIPIKKENLLGLGYDYIAMGHIHKPQIICPDKIAYAGALEPIDKNDTGAHGYIYGEITTKGCRIRFVPFAMRSYIHQTIEVNPSMTEHELKETVAKVIDEKGKEKLKKIFPGYILVEMVMTDEAWFVVRNTPGVTGFIGSSGKGAKPFPLTPAEVDKILGSMGMSRLDIANELEVGTTVKVTSGPFANMVGKIKSIDMENQELEVALDLFGQETTVELKLAEIEKVL